MKSIILLISVLVMSVFIIPANGSGKGELQKHFQNVANEVKATENPAEKRIILENSLRDMSRTLDKVQNSFLVSKRDSDGIEKLKTTLKENQDELAGTNGYERVADSQLNNFSSYVVQNMQQADGTITISVVALVIIILLAVLIF